MNRNKLLVAALGSVLALPALAENAAPKAPTLDAVLEASGISITGDMEVSYSHLSSLGKFTSGTNSRVFDYTPNALTVQAIDFTIAKQPAEGAGGLVDMTMGKDASTIAAFGTAQPNQTYDLTQAYLQYAKGGTTVIAGKFITLAGQEYIKTASNTNHSRSILFGYAIPYTHTGVRATYKSSDAFSFILGANNGWDQAADMNSNKTTEVGISLNPSKSFSLIVQDYYGVEQVAGAPGGMQGKRNLLDFVATFNLSDSLSIVVNYDKGTQENAPLAMGGTGSAKWSGVAAYLNYQISEPWRISLRGESFNDADGYRTGLVQKWSEATMTVGYALEKNLELRGELRADRSDKAAFAYADGINRKTQRSTALEAVYKF